ncbi:hypothetical protein O6H91_Y491500 [Diphasiastrum complanatum]|nr:hypothetical protein O6H91_Y491500 [Diphasiastrum complanatum]
MEETIQEEVLIDNLRVKASFSSSSGLLKWTGQGNGSLILEKDLLGISTGPLTITLHAFQLPNNACCGDSQRLRRDIVIDFDLPASHNLWHNEIQNCLNSYGRPKRLLLLVNPFSGKKGAQSVYKAVVEPLLKAAGIHITLRETKFQRHAEELVKSLNLTQFDGIVCVSGDGILVESFTQVLNGLMKREDWEQAIKTPLGIVPAGTGNGMAKSLLDAAGEPCDASNATFAVIRGHTQSLDVAKVVQGNVIFHSLLLLTWGFIADVDIESEKFRWLGSLRLDFYTLLRIMWLRHYDGKLAYLPAPGYEETGRPYTGELHSEAEVKSEGNHSDIRHKNGKYTSDWRYMDGAFIMVSLQNVPWASQDFLAAPFAKFSDGCLDMIILRDCPQWTLLNLLMTMQNGNSVKSKYLEYVKVKAFRLSPGGRIGSDVQGGYIDLDGEVVARGVGAEGDGSKDLMLYGPTIDVSILRGLATVFSPV